MTGLGELGDKPEATSLRGGGPDLSHSSGLESFMKWFPVGRFVNDIMGRWHDTPESRVPDPAGCTRLRPGQYGVALSNASTSLSSLKFSFSYSLDFRF